jgi:hypothetical protein
MTEYSRKWNMWAEIKLHTMCSFRSPTSRNEPDSVHAIHHSGGLKITSAFKILQIKGTEFLSKYFISLQRSNFYKYSMCPLSATRNTPPPDPHVQSTFLTYDTTLQHSQTVYFHKACTFTWCGHVIITMTGNNANATKRADRFRSPPPYPPHNNL